MVKWPLSATSGRSTNLFEQSLVRNPRLCADALKEIHAVEMRIRYHAVT